MKRLPAFSMIAASFACVAFALTGCSVDDGMAGDSLPQGKYPMTFSTAVEGLSVTRATVDNTWEGNEEIAVKVDNEVKKYKPTSNGNSFTLTGLDAENTLYWQKTTENISAWYLGTGTYSATLPTQWTVKSDQSGEGYQQSDFLYAPETSINFADRNTASLTFHHQTAKVVINILNADAVTDALQITGVSLVNMSMTADYTAPQGGSTAGTWSNWSIPAENGIIPKTLAATPDNTDNILKSYTVLVIPQDMANKKFIKVTANGNDYYYTPAAGEATLQSGKQHTYNITVKNPGLVVTTETPVSWQDESLSSSSPAETTTFRILLSGNGTLPTLSNLNGITSKGTNVYETNGNSFSFTIPKDGRNGFLHQGFAQMTQQEADENVIYTYTNVRSDLHLEYGDCPQVGDYYYADGSWSSEYISGNSPSCIGIVFRIGIGTSDQASNYENLPSIHGYVVALKDAAELECNWGKREQSTTLTNIYDANNPDYNGYSNTATIINIYQNGNDWTYYQAFQAIIDYRSTTPAPAESSDWYLPSLKQLSDIFDLYKGEAGNTLYDKLTVAGGQHFRAATPGSGDIAGGYWTSTQMNSWNAWYVRFADKSGAKEPFSKGQLSERNCFVRAILTF